MLRIILPSLFLVLHLSNSFADISHGDTVEFYLSAKGLPSTDAGTPELYYYEFQAGVLNQGSGNIWFDPVNRSGIAEGPNPVWSENLYNMTYLRIDWVLYSKYRVRVSRQDGSQMMFWHDDHDYTVYAYRSCLSGSPYEVQTRENFTISFHCTRYFPFNPPPPLVVTTTTQNPSIKTTTETTTNNSVRNFYSSYLIIPLFFSIVLLK